MDVDPPDASVPQFSSSSGSASSASRPSAKDLPPMPALEVIIRLCPDLPEEEVVEHFQTSTLEALGEWDLYFTFYYFGVEGVNEVSLPHDLAVLVSDSWSGAEKEKVVKAVPKAPPCCMDMYFTPPLQKPFEKALVELNGNVGVDFGPIVEEMMMIRDWAMELLMCTKAAEILHVVSKYLERCIGAGHSRDVVAVNASFELVQVAREFMERRGLRTLPNARKELLRDARDSVPEREKAKSLRGGNILWFFLAEKRKAWAAAGGRRFS